MSAGKAAEKLGGVESTRDLLESPADELVAGGEVVIGGGELAAVSVLVVEPGIDHGVDGSLAVFGGGHKDVIALREHGAGRAADGDGADVFDEDGVGVLENGAVAVDEDLALLPVGADDVLAENAVEV